jgi:hypothetical protein
MASAKTATLTFRIKPELKESLQLASVNEFRSIINMIKVMVRDYCGCGGDSGTNHQQRPQETSQG